MYLKAHIKHHLNRNVTHRKQATNTERNLNPLCFICGWVSVPRFIPCYCLLVFLTRFDLTFQTFHVVGVCEKTTRRTARLLFTRQRAQIFTTETISQVCTVHAAALVKPCTIEMKCFKSWWRKVFLKLSSRNYVHVKSSLSPFRHRHRFMWWIIVGVNERSDYITAEHFWLKDEFNLKRQELKPQSVSDRGWKEELQQRRVWGKCFLSIRAWKAF